MSTSSEWRNLLRNVLLALAGLLVVFSLMGITMSWRLAITGCLAGLLTASVVLVLVLSIRRVRAYLYVKRYMRNKMH